MKTIEQQVRDLAGAIGVMSDGDIEDLRQAFVEANALWARLNILLRDRA